MHNFERLKLDPMQITRRTFLQGERCAFTSVRPGQSRSHFHFAIVAVGRAKAPQPAPVPADLRLRLNNLAPQPGSRDKETRKGRGYGAGQVSINTCGTNILKFDMNNIYRYVKRFSKGMMACKFCCLCKGMVYIAWTTISTNGLALDCYELWLSKFHHFLQVPLPD